MSRYYPALVVFIFGLFIVAGIVFFALLWGQKKECNAKGGLYLQGKCLKVDTIEL